MSGTLTKAQKFEEVTSAKGFDQDHRRKINFNMGRYHQAVSKGVEDYRDLELARDRAAEIRWRAIENLESNLLRFESTARDNGVKVVWADDATQALDAVLEVLRRHRTKLVVKSKSMVTEEIHLNSGLEKHGIRVVETDLGEYIQQLDEEPPYHIVTPAMHKSKEDVAALFHRKLGTVPHASPEALTLHARNLLRDQYLEAGVGITGANFLLADSGGVGVTENEGNARMCTTFVKSHIVIAGIEKVIESSEDLDLMWPLLASRGTGQQMTAYNTVFHGPRRNSETDGPSEMVVILLDNGHASILALHTMRGLSQCLPGLQEYRRSQLRHLLLRPHRQSHQPSFAPLFGFPASEPSQYVVRELHRGLPRSDTLAPTHFGQPPTSRERSSSPFGNLYSASAVEGMGQGHATQAPAGFGGFPDQSLVSS
jgi:L-lactate dehydrogenase complex protein LldF